MHFWKRFNYVTDVASEVDDYNPNNDEEDDDDDSEGTVWFSVYFNSINIFLSITGCVVHTNQV